MENQQINEQPQEQLKKGKPHVWLWVIGGLIALLLIIFLVSKDLFSQVLAWLLIIGLPLLSIVVIISPLFIVKRLRHRFDFLTVLISLPVIVVLVWVVWQFWRFFLDWVASGVGEAFLSIF